MRITIINDFYFRKCYDFDVLKSEVASFPRTGPGSLTDLQNLKLSKQC